MASTNNMPMPPAARRAQQSASQQSVSQAQDSAAAMSAAGNDFDKLTGGQQEDAPAQSADATLQAASTQLRLMEQQLSQRWLERERAIHGILVGLIAKQHGVLLGSPGEAKSALIDDVRKRVTGARGFKLLMTRFTTPEEVFGPISIQGLKEDRYARMTEGYLPDAHFPFLDEPFKAGSSILNTLLTGMNERQFTNDGRVIPIPLRSLFGASNEMPQGEELGALWDRFTLRFEITPLRGAGLRRFMIAQKALAGRQDDGTGQHSAFDPEYATITLEQLDALHDAMLVAKAQMTDRTFDLYEDVLRSLAQKGFKLPSTRRTGWALNLIAANAVMNGRTRPTEGDLTILGDVLWDHIKEAREVSTLVLKAAAPRLAEAQDIMDSVLQVRQGCIDFWNEDHQRAQKNAKVVEARGKIAEEGARLRRLYQEAIGAQEDATALKNLIDQAKLAFEEVTALPSADAGNWSSVN